MKLSLYTLVVKDRTIEEIFKLAKEIGYDGVELWGRAPHLPPDTTEERAKEIRKLADEYGLEIPAIGAYITDFSTSSDADCKKALEDLEKYLKLMNILKCDMIRVGAGGPNAFLAQDYHFSKALYWVDKCAELALQYNKKIVIEIHNVTLTETIEGADKFIKKLNRDNVGLIHDAGNMYITGTDYGVASIQLLGEKIFHVHVKDELRVEDDSLPGAFHNITKYGDEVFQQKKLGEGGVDSLPLFKELLKTGYSRYLSCECLAAGPDIERASHDFKEMKKLIEIAKSEL